MLVCIVAWKAAALQGGCRKLYNSQLPGLVTSLLICVTWINHAMPYAIITNSTPRLAAHAGLGVLLVMNALS